MKPKSVEFYAAAAAAKGFPRPDLPEFAFAGRSNVGKSSLINMVVGESGIARTSNTPGRTRLLYWFKVVPQKGKPIAFVDLPGYGYAKVPRKLRESWRPLVESYLIDRPCLRAVLVLIDARRGAQREERELLEWLEAESIDALVVLTKIDKLPKSKRKPVALAMKRELGLAREPLATSAETREGLTELWRFFTRNT
jgi:GTP-binding protein